LLRKFALYWIRKAFHMSFVPSQGGALCEFEHQPCGWGTNLLVAPSMQGRGNVLLLPRRNDALPRWHGAPRDAARPALSPVIE